MLSPAWLNVSSHFCPDVSSSVEGCKLPTVCESAVIQCYASPGTQRHHCEEKGEPTPFPWELWLPESTVLLALSRNIVRTSQNAGSSLHVHWRRPLGTHSFRAEHVP